MARKSYQRPSEETLLQISAGVRLDMQEIEAHAPLWVTEPDRIGLESPETAALLYGLGFNIPRGQEIEYVDVRPSGGGWIVEVEVTDGRAWEADLDADLGNTLIKEPYTGLAARVRFEGVETSDLVGSL